MTVTGGGPRGSGAAPAVDDEGTVIGSVSGGRVEGVVEEPCPQALRDGGTVLERFGSSDDASAAGLTRGGSLSVLVTPVRAADPVRPVLAPASVAGSGPAG